MYGGLPAEQRRGERRRKLLDAGLELIGTQGWGATSVRGVCQHAKLSSRFFYENFADLNTLAVAVFDEILGDTLAAVLPAFDAAGEDPTPRVRAGIRALILALTDDPRKARIGFVEALGSEPLMKRRLQTMHTIAELFIAEIHRAHPVSNDESYVHLAALGLAGALVELMVAWTNDQLDRTRDQLINDLSDLAVSHINAAIQVANQRD